MKDVWLILFIVNFTLLLIHEMDAVKNREWRMFIILKSMPEEKACRVFTIAHIPLYAAALLLLISPSQQILFYVLDVFLIGHAVIHFCFRHHENNAFTSVFSKTIIYLMGGFAAVHLAGILLTA